MNVLGAVSRFLADRAYLGPLVVTALLIAPCIGTTYLWDDFDFLNNALSFRVTDLLPSAARPSEPFYRPISRGIYFAVLDAFGPAGQLVGHLINAVVLLVIVFLLFRLAQGLRGTRSAVVTGLAFAGLGIAPLLVCWASGSQDLIAMAFVLLAAHLHLSGRTGFGILCAALGVLSKETVLVVIPAIALSRWILYRDRARLGKTLAMYTALIAAWLFLHPGIHRLIENGLRSGATGYVGLEHPERWPIYFAKYLLVLLNGAPAEPSWSLTISLLPYLVAAATTAYFLTRSGTGESQEMPAHHSAPISRVCAWALLLLMPPLLLSSTFLRSWVPYYAVFAGLGWALLLGALSERVRPAVLSVSVAAFVVFGGWSRTATLEPGAVTEHNLRATSLALDQVQRNLKRIRPTMPRGAQMLVSVQAGGLTGLYTHLYYFQALRVWYRDPNLTTTRPDWRKPSGGHEVLLWISSNLEVFEIDLDPLAPHGTSDAISYEEFLRTLRYYARGLAAGGETDRALQVLLSVNEPSQSSWALDRRLAAMFLFYANRDAEAIQLLRFVPRVRRDNALEIVARLLTDPPPGPSWDGPALRAFNIDRDDPEACRYLMRHFAKLERKADSIRFAVRLLTFIPNDREARETLERLRATSALEPFRLPTDPGIW